uniref:G-protein coupled receptors family 1 profile domain-containing protein n=1 Tax=Ficedula albicollis TaxID=59894 RepID=A0A803VCT6_FICAL
VSIHGGDHRVPISYDLCEIDVTNVAMHSVALLICLCGLVGNGAVLWLLGSHHVSRNSTPLYILTLTFIDFLFLLFLVSASLLFLLEDVSCSVIMPLLYVWVLSQLSLVSYITWLYLLTFISIWRCRSIHCPLWHCCHRPQHLSKVVCALLWAFSISVITLFATWFSLCHILLHSGTCCSQKGKPKRLHIVIFLSLLMILPLSLWNFLQQLSYTILLFLLAGINNTIKPFIYFLVGRCWKNSSMTSLRESLQKILGRSPSTFIAAGEGSRGSAKGHVGGMLCREHIGAFLSSSLTGPRTLSPKRDHGPHC